MEIRRSAFLYFLRSGRSGSGRDQEIKPPRQMSAEDFCCCFNSKKRRGKAILFSFPFCLISLFLGAALGKNSADFVMIDRSDLKRLIHHKNVSNLSDSMVWYNMFIIFVMYCMLPVPVKWCTVCCLLTAIIHIIVLAALVKQSEKRQPDGSIINKQPNPVWNVFSIGLLYLGKPFRLCFFMIKH